jgi:LysM repeat protein
MSFKISSFSTNTSVSPQRNGTTSANTAQSASQPAATGFSTVSNFTAASKPALSLDGASAPRLDPRAGMGGNPYPDTTEFGHALSSAFDQFGTSGANKVQGILDQINQHQTPSPLSTAVPSPGDIMVWGPEAGDRNSPDAVLGKANGEGHMAVVEAVDFTPPGKVTLTVSERNWDDSDSETTRRIVLDLNSADGSVRMPPNGDALPAGVGFVQLNNPRPGPNPTVQNDHFRGNNWPASNTNTNDGWIECMGYIHDMPEYGPVIDAMANGRNDFNAGNIPPNSTTPQVGGLMVWAPNSGGNGEVPSATGKGHVAYVEDVQRNYDPPGDPNGRVVSYTLTISEANARGNNGDEVTLKTFTVSADESGQIKMPEGVGFYNLGSGSVPTPEAPGTDVSTPSTGEPITGTSYQVHSGDTLEAIAQRAGVSVQALAAANHIADVNLIYAGQVLAIPR